MLALDLRLLLAFTLVLIGRCNRTPQTVHLILCMNHHLIPSPKSKKSAVAAVSAAAPLSPFC